MEYIEPVELAP